MAEVKMEDIVSLAKRRGFIYPGSDVYGGLSGTWDYGPLGVALKRNITNLWWKMFIDDRDDMYGVDAAILMNQKVWQASGHVDTFTDPLVECSNCKGRFRADKLDDPNRCPTCSKEGTFGESKQFNMMFKTTVGPSEFIGMETLLLDAQTASNKINEIQGPSYEDLDRSLEAFQEYLSSTINYFTDTMQSTSYLRPETAQGIFTNYKNIVDNFYPDLPFGIGQHGKAFRNEISPRDFVFRSREFEQMEIEYFIREDTWEENFEHWRQQWHAYFDALGLPAESIHELEVPEEDRAHYSKRTVDFEFDYPIGKEELAGLAYRTDFDLMNIQNNAKKSMEYAVKGTNEKLVPHVIEPTIGVERALMAVMTAAYREDEQNGEKRVFLALPEHLAPYKYCVSPLLKNKPELVDKAREVYVSLKKKYGNVTWDDNGNIGKRYRRQDEIGTPNCMVIDFQTLEDDTVTIRDRDTTEQKRLSLQNI